MASWAVSMFGDKLVSKEGEVSTEKALADKVVGIYFSAHWCPPCRGFTPKLAEIYKTVKEAGKNFEVVFVSSDEDDAEFKEYYGEMPWLALPFDKRDLKGTLNSKFKVSGIPTLVLLNTDGTTITKDGRSSVMRPVEEFPWVPPTLQECIGDKFVDKSGNEVTLKSLQDAGTKIGLYFSAHWCGPCRNFTPKLVATYNKLKEEGKPFEVIFVSSDRDDASFNEYYGEMPWLALPFADRKRKEQLSDYFKVQGIPSFVMLDSDLSTINPKARGTIGGDPEGAKFPWSPPLVTDIEEDCDGINGTPACIVLMEEAGDRWDDLRSALEEVAMVRAQADKKEGEGRSMLFLTVTETGGGIGGHVRKLCKLGKPTATPQLLMLDCGSDRYYAHKGDVDAVAIRKVVGDMVVDGLEMTPLE